MILANSLKLSPRDMALLVRCLGLKRWPWLYSEHLLPHTQSSYFHCMFIIPNIPTRTQSKVPWLTVTERPLGKDVETRSQCRGWKNMSYKNSFYRMILQQTLQVTASTSIPKSLCPCCLYLRWLEKLTSISFSLFWDPLEMGVAMWCSSLTLTEFGRRAGVEGRRGYRGTNLLICFPVLHIMENTEYVG